MPQSNIEERLAQLEATEAIRQLKSTYCLHCDRGYEPDRLAELFTADAVWDGGSGGRYVGREAIRAFFAKASGRFPFAAHLVMNPLITVDGDRATGQWRMLMPCILRDGSAEVSALQVAEYDETYRRAQGGWLIQSLSVRRRRLEFKDASWDLR